MGFKSGTRRLPKKEPGAEKAKKAPEERDSVALYFREIAEHGLLSPKEEGVLTRKIAGHFETCADTLVMLLTVGREIVRRPANRPLPCSLPEKKAFAEHPFVKNHMTHHELKGDEGLRSAARHLMRLVDPGASEGEHLRKAVVKMVKDTACAAFLETFVSREAKRDIDEMARRNLRLVITIAKRRVRHAGLPLSDLIQEGNLGLLKAISRFEPKRGWRFSTYASWWIRHAVDRAISDKSRTIRIPVHAHELHAKIGKTRQALLGKIGRDPTVHEIAKELDIPVSKVRDRLTDLRKDVSLDAPAYHSTDDATTSFADVLRLPEKEHHPDEILIGEEEGKNLREALTFLRPMEQDVIRRRFGLEDDNPVTLKEIAVTYGLSRERIRQIQEDALRKLRRRMGVTP